MKNLTPHGTISIAVVAAVGLFSLAIFLSASGRYFFKSTYKSDISVTGSASIDFTSDLVVWHGTFKKQDMDLKEAYSMIKEDRAIIEEFLLSKGVSKDEFSFLSIDIDKRFRTKNHFNNDGDVVDRESIFNGYELSQQVQISSTNINLVESISNEVTDLIEKDIFITSHNPSYYYTKLSELKIEMIQLAAEDGLLRAQTAVEGGNAYLGDLLETSIGVFQILGTNSSDSYSWGGTLNTSHKFKTAYVNVKQKYEIE